MVRDEIATLLKRAGEAAQATGVLPAFALPDVLVQRPANPAHGDYASSLPLKLARAARMSPLAIAHALLSKLPESELFARVDIASPGFINFTLRPEWLSSQVEVIIDAGSEFGKLDLGGGKTVQIEFISANPTGPLTVASGRGGALGDALGNLLSAAGYRVSREYYINDAGSRMEAFNQTLFARYLQALGQDAPVPADGYHGAYMLDIARDIAAAEGDRYLKMPQNLAEAELGRIGLRTITESIKSTVAALGIDYDVWFSEQTLYDRDIVAQTVSLLRERGYVEEREGAVWLVAGARADDDEKAQEDKANVLVRSNGIPTYFASDIAYHYDKFVVRGFDQVIDIWGADHHGHVKRMKNGISAIGVNPDRLTVILHQLITLRRGEEIVKISKRTGNIITLAEVIEEVGPDACRFFFLSRSADSVMDFDLDLAKKQSNDNPVYYVQYAHARIAGILRYAGEIESSAGDVSLLKHDAEQALIRKMLEFPEMIELAASTNEPHHLPHYAQDLAAVFHQFYTQCRVVDSENPALSQARLKLALAAKNVLANCLGVMGISAPEKMDKLAEEAVG